MNTRVVEIIGPAGVGKTTLRDTILQQQGKHLGFRICSVEHVLREPRLQRPRFLLRALDDLVGRSCRVKPPRVLYRQRSISEEFVTLASSDETWEEFLKYSLKLCERDNRSAAKRLLAHSYLLASCSHRLVIESLSNNDRVVLMDEPVGYRPSLFDPDSRSNEASIHGYYERVPLPAAIIHIDATVDTVVDRIIERDRRGGKTALRHRKLDKTQLKRDTEWARHLSHTGAAILSSRGVPSHTVRGECDLQQSAAEVMSFLVELFETRPCEE